MPGCDLTLINARGLHARAASKFVDVAKAYGCDVSLTVGDKTVDGKSIMALLMLGAPVGSQLQLETSGDEADEALAALQALVEAGFDELDED